MAKSKQTAKTAATENIDNESTGTSTGHYEEWRCEIKIDRSEDGKETKRYAEKVKRIRPVVKISDEEAETLNSGALNSPRQDYVLMYFKPE
jgi:hypothetical protein